MTGLAFTRLSLVVVAMAALIGCSSGAPSTVRPGTPSTPPSAAPATPAGGPSTAEGLCGVFTADLALAALGVPVDEPTGGDVVPRPNGIYCHYAAAGDDNTTVEAQLKDMTRDEFDQSVEFFGLTEPLDGVGEVAFQLGRSTLGVPGAFVMAWANGRRVTVLINSDGEQATLMNGAKAIAVRVLASP